MASSRVARGTFTVPVIGEVDSCDRGFPLGEFLFHAKSNVSASGLLVQVAIAIIAVDQLPFTWARFGI
jgi:hypothetical protein